LELPANPTEEQLETLQAYLKQQKKKISKKGYGKQNFYKEKEDLIAKKLIIFKNKQSESNNWYMRYYVGDRKYKQMSLRTSDKQKAKEKALEEWRILETHVQGGGNVFEKKISEYIDEYMQYIYDLLRTEQLKKHTITAKRTSIKKLRAYLEKYEKPSKVPPNVFKDYVKWRRTVKLDGGNWDKGKHKNNPRPPSNLTINKELTDFKGFFDWCRETKVYVQDIDYPFIKIEYNKLKEKNPSWEDPDWKAIVYYLRTWERKTHNLKGNEKKWLFYRKVFSCFLKVLVNSGMRSSEALLLKWADVEIKVRDRKNQKSGRVDKQEIAHILIPPETKTGSRKVICPAGTYFRQVWHLYLDETGNSPRRDDFVFRNIGTKNSRQDAFIGMPLTSTFLRKLWYEMMDEFKVDKGREFYKHYTLHSCRAYFINTRLELGVPPAVVGDLVGHTLKTMEKHYKNIRLMNLESDIVNQRRRALKDSDFLTYDLDTGNIVTL
tara:strand:+ start:862 stop:2334 length:1473 start_codon:yes stop_codon:yes gene_type:complete